MKSSVDTLNIIGKLKKAGFDQEQAETIMEVFGPAMDSLKKEDMIMFSDQITTIFRELRHNLTNRIEKLEYKIESVEQKLIARIYAAQLATVIAVFAILSYFNTL